MKSPVMTLLMVDIPMAASKRASPLYDEEKRWKASAALKIGDNPLHYLTIRLASHPYHPIFETSHPLDPELVADPFLFNVGNG